MRTGTAAAAGLRLAVIGICFMSSVTAPVQAADCNLLSGGNPCNAGCPDECSPVLCPHKALCESKCGGSSCNLTCSPGPCGAGCPDECSPVICPGNALCNSTCGGSSCNVTCSPGPCGAGCADECNPLLCPGNPCACAGAGEGCLVSANCCGDLVCAFPQQTCRHDPPTSGEPCSAAIPCRSDLRCIDFVCEKPRTVGEGCLFTSDCADGLDCRPCLADGCRRPLMCFPQAGLGITDEHTCRSLFSPALRDEAVRANLTTSFGVGTALSGGISGTAESGTVYGQDGEYGCFVTDCLGAILNAGVGSFTAVGFYTSFDDFKGTAVNIVESAGEGVSFSTSQVLDLGGHLVGTEDAFSVEVSVLPITAGVYQCNAVVDTFDTGATTTTTSTVLGATTTTTSTSLPHQTLESLATALAQLLPDPDGMRGRPKAVARRLARLARRAMTELHDAQAAHTPGGRTRRYRRATRALARLLAQARRADAHASLTVALAPIESLTNAILLRLPK